MAKLSIVLSGDGHEAARHFVRAVIASSRARGLEQAALARRAGISAESLSRLKKAGRCRLATALQLARAAGFGELELVERSAARAASLAAQKLSASRRLPITAKELVRMLRAAKPAKANETHLLGFFEELPIESVHDVVLAEGLEYADLLALANALGAEGETVEWLQEMACDSVA